MADNDTIQIDPSLVPQIPLTGQVSGSSPQASNVTWQNLSQFLPDRNQSTPSGNQSTQQQFPQVGDLAQIRTRFSQELANPEMRRLLTASTQAEVGGQGPTAEQAYMESVVNRASAEGRSLQSVLLDTDYYPKSTQNKLFRTFPQDEQDRHNQMIDSVLAGSNVSNMGTGNESGSVHSGGAEVTFNPRTGERFVAENWTVPWRNQMLIRLNQPPPQQLAQANIQPQSNQRRW